MREIVFVGGSLDAFCHFRLPLIREFLKCPSIHVTCIYFDNRNDFNIPSVDQDRCQWVNLACDHSSTPFRDFRSINRLRKIIGSINPDAVLCFNAKPIVYIGMLKCLFFKSLYTTALFEGLGGGFKFLQQGTFLSALKTFCVRRVVRSFQKWVFLNEHDLSLFTNLNFVRYADGAILVNGIGVDLEYYSTNSSMGATREHLSVGFAGRLIVEKGINVFIETAKIVKQQLPWVNFCIATFASEIDDKTQKDWLDSNVVSSINYYPDMRDFYNQISILMLPTIYQEGLPAVVMEAQSMALPVLVNDRPQTKKSIHDKFSGFLVSNNCPKIYASHIIKLLTCTETYSLLKNEARKYAVSNFDVYKTSAHIAKHVLEG